MVKVRNISEGPRGLYVKGNANPVMLDTGPDFVELDVEAGELESARKTGWFEIKGEPAKADEPDADLAKAVAELDHRDDKQWSGKNPNLEHLAKVLGRKVERSDVDALGVERKT